MMFLTSSSRFRNYKIIKLISQFFIFVLSLTAVSNTFAATRMARFTASSDTQFFGPAKFKVKRPTNPTSIYPVIQTGNQIVVAIARGPFGSRKNKFKRNDWRVQGYSARSGNNHIILCLICLVCPAVIVFLLLIPSFIAGDV